MESGNNIGVIELYVIKRYFEELTCVCPKNIIKDVTVEINQNSNFPNRLEYISVLLRYKDDLILSCDYSLNRVSITFNYEEDAKNFIKVLKNRIFQNYCKDLED